MNRIIGIIPIVNGLLYSIKYDDGFESEFDRLMDLWNDTEYVHSYFEDNIQYLINIYWRDRDWKIAM